MPIKFEEYSINKDFSYKLNFLTLEVFFILNRNQHLTLLKIILTLFKIILHLYKKKLMKLPIICPSCDHTLNVSQMKCPDCGTNVNGDYELPVFLKLNRDEQDFILNFFLSSGSIKEMAKQAELSYPTMRNKMDDLIKKIDQLKK